MVYCIALTGNIASGKTTAARVFRKLGVKVINADDIAKQLTQKGMPALASIYHHFGASILTSDGELNRRQLRSIIFENPTEKRWLENLLHPLIRSEIEQKVAKTSSQMPYVMVEIPLLPKREQYPYVNRILAILSPKDILFERLMERDAISEENAEAILSAQASEAEHRKNADDIIVNDGLLQQLEEKIHQYHQACLKRSKRL